MEKILTELSNIFNSFWTFLAFGVIAFLNFFAPTKTDIMLVAGLVIVDIITALFALWMVCRRDNPTILETMRNFYAKWTSARAFDTVPKFAWYGMLVLLSYGVGFVLADDGSKYAKLATGIISYVEIRSIIENGDKAFGTSIWELAMDYVKRLLPSKK